MQHFDATIHWERGAQAFIDQQLPHAVLPVAGGGAHVVVDCASLDCALLDCAPLSATVEGSA